MDETEPLYFGDEEVRGEDIRAIRRERKRPKMKVSGRSVFLLKKLIEKDTRAASP